MFGKLTTEECSCVIAYSLENEVLTNAELNIEKISENNDDEQDVGYNG